MYIVIPTHNEESVFRLLPIVLQNKNPNDKVIIYDDFSEQAYLDKIKAAGDLVIHQHKLELNFADHWNHVHQLVPQGEWIVYIASDELVNDEFFSSVTCELATASVQKFLLPRINTYYDETTEEWTMPQIDWHNPTGEAYPDWQTRICINLPHIRWHGKVHESIIGNIGEKMLLGKPFTLIHHRSTQKVARSRELYVKIGHKAYGNG